MATKKNLAALVLGSALTAGTMSVANAAGTCGAGKCGGQKQQKKQAQGTCGGNKNANATCGANKKAQGSCGSQKNPQGKCGAGKNQATMKCGAGKCGGQK